MANQEIAQNHRPPGAIRFKKAAEEPGPVANYALIRDKLEHEHDSMDCVKQTTESLQTILHLVLLMCIVAKAPELIFGIKDFITTLVKEWRVKNGSSN